MPKNTDPPGYHSREITHHIVEQFKNHFSGTTDAGFRCHCGHKGGVQFTDYQAMTSPVAWVLPSVVCDRVIAAWRAHTKDLDGVHPNAEDQIRDFFSRHLEQPGGPTVTTARCPLTTIPRDTPKPKSLTISASVDEDLRRIIVDYAGKLGIAVVPVESRWFDWLVTDRPTSLKSVSPAAMREYLARLLYGDEGDRSSVPPVTGIPEGAPQQEEAEQPIVYPNVVSPPLDRSRQNLSMLREAAEDFLLLGAHEGECTNVDDDSEACSLHLEACRRRKDRLREVLQGVPEEIAEPLEKAAQPVATNRPTRIILRSYAADDKPRIERLLGLARQLQIPVQLAGPWSCTAFPKGEEAHPALDVVFPEVLVHPRNVLILTFPNGEHIGDNGGSNLSEIENQLLWETREQDQRFITSLVELLGLHAEASRGDIAAAVERSGTHYEALDARVRNILGAVDGEETDEAARRFVEAQEKVHAELGKQLEKEKRETQNRIRVETARLNNETGPQAGGWVGLGEGGQAMMTKRATVKHVTQRQIEAITEQINADDALFGVALLGMDAGRRWTKLEVYSKAALSTGQRERLVWAVNCGLKDCQATDLVRRDLNHPARWATVKRWLREMVTLRPRLVWHRDLVKRLGLPKAAGWVDIMNAVDSDRNLHLRAALATVEKERDDLKEQLETAITAERRTIAQRIDLALTGNAAVTNLDVMLRAVEACREGYTREASRSVNLRRDCEMLQGLIGQIADALDAPPGDRLVVKDDGSLNTTLADRVVGYFKRLYTAAGFTEPPQGGWSEILSNVEDTLAGECPLPSR